MTESNAPAGNRGCLELYANIHTLIKSLAHAGALEAENISPSRFEELSLMDKCDKVFSDTALKLSYALINAVNLLILRKYFWDMKDAGFRKSILLRWRNM